MLSYRYGLCTIEVLIHCQKTHERFFARIVANLFVFYHDACFFARATNKITLIWVIFHLVATKPFEKSVFEAFSNFNIMSPKPSRQK